MKKAILLCIITLLSTGAINAQEKLTLDVKDLNSDIEKYIKKIYPEFKATEAFMYDLLYGVKIQKGDSTIGLVFDRDAKFKTKYTTADKEKYAMQPRSTMSLDNVDSDISKYVNKNHEGYKITEAYSLDVVYVVKVMKAEESESLMFDKDGKFIKKMPKPAAMATPAAAPAAVDPAKTDTIPK